MARRTIPTVGQAGANVLLAAIALVDFVAHLLVADNWGPGACKGAVVITVGQSLQDDERAYASVVQVATNACDYCMTYEDSLPVYLCTLPKSPLPVLWATVKHFD